MDLWTIDSQPDRVQNVPRSISTRYQDLGTEFIQQFDAILWFAGHSSVKTCAADPLGAVRNNCSDLIEFVGKKADRTKFIYASSASVYSEIASGYGTPKRFEEAEAMAAPETTYDASKVAFDSLVSVVGKNSVGLRMGTVSGWSSCLRPELIFNAMNISAMTDEVVWVSNPAAARTILFLDDLYFYVKALLASSAEMPGILNLGSLNLRIGELAEFIAGFHAVSLKEVKTGPTYSFNMSLELAGARYGFPEKPSLECRCKQFVEDYLNEGNRN